MVTSLGLIVLPPQPTPFGDTLLGFWIQTGAFIISAVGAVSVIWYNGLVARQRATVDLVLHQKSDKDLIAALSIVYEMNREEEKFTDHLPNLQSDKGKAIRLVLNSHEFVALGIRRKAFDEKLYKEMQCSNFLKVWMACRGLVYEIRKQEAKETIFQEIEWLAGRWSESPVEKINRKKWYFGKR